MRLETVQAGFMTQAVLNIDRLRQACTLLLDQVENKYGPELQIANLPIGLYWEIDLRTSFTMTDSPPIVAGDFVDDVESTDQLLTRNTDEIYLWHDLGHLSAVLRGLAFL